MQPIPQPSQIANATIADYVLARIVAVHKAASDRDRSSPVLSSVLMRLHSGNQVTICATDGKMLVEETYPTISQSNCSSDSLDMLLSGEAIKGLAAMLKATADRKRPWELQLALVGKQLTILHPKGASVMLRLTEGTFPQYKSALQIPADKPGNTGPWRFGINLDYVARLADLWPGKESSCAEVMAGRGFIFRPLGKHADEGERIALIMPIGLPD